METPHHPSLIRRMRDAGVRRLARTGPLMAGSLVETAKHCGRPGCHCQTGEKHVGWYLTRFVDYEAPFLLWWGLLLHLCKLASLRPTSRTRSMED